MAKPQQFIVEHVGPRNSNGGWRLMQSKSKVMEPLVGETKRSFVKRARAHVRSFETGPRQLMIRKLDGTFVDEASYDCDSPAKG